MCRHGTRVHEVLLHRVPPNLLPSSKLGPRIDSVPALLCLGRCVVIPSILFNRHHCGSGRRRVPPRVGGLASAPPAPGVLRAHPGRHSHVCVCRAAGLFGRPRNDAAVLTSSSLPRCSFSGRTRRCSSRSRARSREASPIRRTPHKYMRTLMDVVTVAAAAQAAGFAHQALGGTLGQFEWPFEAGPIAGDSRCVLHRQGAVGGSGAAAPRETAAPPIVARAELLDCPIYFIGAAIAVAARRTDRHRMWEVLPVVAVPLLFRPSNLPRLYGPRWTMSIGAAK